MKFLKLNTLIFCTLVFLPYSLLMAYEEPNIKLFKKMKFMKLENISDRLAVETIDSDSENNFRKLFNYISGRNEDNEKIKMTTPVTQFEKMET